MARWPRARRLLQAPTGARVLDLGCAFGYGTRLFESKYETYGHDLSLDYIERARRGSTKSTFTWGPADAIPYADGYFDGVLLLDVLEHVPETAPVINEIARVLKRGGQLIVSVPNHGALAALDSLNLYHAWLGGKAAPPTDDPSWSTRPHHRHFTLSELQRMFHPGFTVRDVRYSGLGIAEPINLCLLLVFRALFRAPRLYSALQYIYFAAYLAEDLIATDERGYHMMARLERV